MAFSFNKFKNFLKVKKSEQKLAGSGSLEPEIGFKLSHNAVLSTVKVTVIGARHLPSFFGLTAQAHGYVVKVKLFPGEAKFETKLEESSWPVWNEEFTFQVNQKPKGKTSKSTKASSTQDSSLHGKFLSMTVYALLEQPKVEPEKAKTLEAKKTPKVGDAQEAKPKRAFLEKIQSFKASKSEAVSQSGDENAGQVEVSLLYTTSEDGLRDILQISIHRFRCSVRVMQDQEKHKEPMYLKAAILEANKAEASWKSDLFLPTISTKWDPTVAVVKLQIFRVNIDKVSSYISLGCKNKMGKKIMLGKFHINTDDQVWTPSIRSPGVARTVWLTLLPSKGEKVED